MIVDTPSPVRPSSHRPRRKAALSWKRLLLIAATTLTLILVAGVIVIAVVVHHLNTPATVPPSWRPPTALPQSPTEAAIPPGNLTFDSNRTGNYEIWTMNAQGGAAQELTNDPAYDSWWARISPDRRTILFYRTPKGTHDRDYSKTSLWAMAANGSDQVELRPAGLDGWVFQGHAEWSPNGTELVMFGGSRFSPQIWVTTSLGGNPRPITNRGGSNVDPSWSPDGQTIVFAGCPGSICLPENREIYTVPAGGGQPTRITHDDLPDNDPYFSHDGRELAWLTKLSGGLLSVGTWDIRLIPVVRSGEQVTAAPGARPRLLLPDDDNAINSKPSWSLDDQTIYFHRVVGSLKDGFQIWAINVDGSHLRELTKGQGGANEYPGT